MKKTLLKLTGIILSAILVLGLMPAAFAEDVEHTHEWGDWTVDIPATETSVGREIRVCSLDPSHIDEREIPMLKIDYKLWINGEQIKTDNKKITCGEGFAEFDSATNTLTLDSAEITNSYEYTEGRQALIYSEIENLTVEVKGKTALTGGEAIPDGFVCGKGCNLNVKGDGELRITGTGYGICVEGGSFSVVNTTVKVKSKNSTALWVGKDITFTECRANIITESPYFNAILSDIDGTFTVNDSVVEASSRKATLRFGGGDEDSSTHKVVVNSGLLKLTTTTDYAIFVWNYRDQQTGESMNNGRIYANGGTINITSAMGGTNVADVITGENMNYAEGDSLSDSGHVVLTENPVEFRLWVNGKRLTSESNSVSCGGGTAVYDPREKTLTLNNAEISTPYEIDEYNKAMIYSEIKGLEIALNGVSSISGDAKYGVYSAAGCDLSIIGSGSLAVSGVGTGVQIGEAETSGGSLYVSDAELAVTAKSGAALWVNKDIEITKSKVSAETDSPYFNAVVSCSDGTVKITDSTLIASAKRAAVHFGNGEYDSSEHKFVMNSGTLRLESRSDYGIYIGGCRDDINNETAYNGSVYLNGFVSINSILGGTNLPAENISHGGGMVFTEGASLNDSGRIVLKPETMISPVLVEQKAPTCEEDGVQEHYADGKLKFRDKEGKFPVTSDALIIPATSHRWGKPSYEWNDDGTVTGMAVCENDKNHVMIETAEYSTVIIDEPTCEKDGVKVDTAIFEGDMFDKTVRRYHGVTKTGHKWGVPVYEWAPDNQYCIARAYCENDGEHVLEEICTDIPVESTIVNDGDVRDLYTAKFKNELFGTAFNEVITPKATEPITYEPQPTEYVEPTTAPIATEPAATQPPAPKPQTTVKKKANTITVKTKVVKAKSGKKTVIKKTKAFKISKAVGKVSFAKASGNKLIKITKAGKITVKKGLKKGKTYKLRVKITAKGNSKYNKKTVAKTVRIKIT